jgi:hypothetical protein
MTGSGKLYNVRLIVKQGIAATYEMLPVWCSYHIKNAGFSNVTTAVKEPGWSYNVVLQFFSRSGGALTIVQLTWLV